MKPSDRFFILFCTFILAALITKDITYSVLAGTAMICSFVTWFIEARGK